MILPTVHMNGDSKKTMEDDNLTAYRSITDAMEAIAKACPNGRNFYPQGEGAINQAVAEHRRRLEALEAIRLEYEAILIGIQEQ